MSTDGLPDYPFCLPSYVAALDDGQLAKQELKAEARSWRSEGYADDSHIYILDHNNGVGNIRTCDDEGIDSVLAENTPQIRFILLLPTVHDRIGDQISKDRVAAELFKKNEMYDDNINDLADAGKVSDWKASEFNISQKTLLKILTRYDIAPATCSHIRGQEQIFGSRVTKDANNELTAFEFWYAIRARAYFREIDKDADLKMTVVTKYDVANKSTVVLLKYRSFNDLPNKLKHEIFLKLCELVLQPDTKVIAGNPFAVTLLHFNCTAQWYRRAARDPRDSVRNEEEKAHVLSNSGNEVDAINVRRLHLTMRNLDQDRLQLTFILGVIKSLRNQHDLFYRLTKKSHILESRDSLYHRVEEKFDYFTDQFAYLRGSIEDVSNRAQRLLDLLFSLSGQQNARWNEKVGKQAMHEGASMKAIAIVSMVFLPGTFVFGVLGTNLFMLNEVETPSGGTRLEFQASKLWWILLAVTVPLTGLTFALWFLWRARSEDEIRRKIAAEDVEAGKLQNLAQVDRKTKSEQYLARMVPTTVRQSKRLGYAAKIGMRSM